VPIRARTPLMLAVLIVVAAALAGWLPGDAVARVMFESTFQSSPPAPGITPTPTPTLFPTAPVIATPIESPTPLPAKGQLATPTVALPGVVITPTEVGPTPTLPAATPTVLAAARGYLPPPTLTVPGAFANGQGLPQEIGPRTSQGQTGPSVDPQAVAAPPAASETARLIDNLVSLLSYGWLCCGSLVVMALAVSIVWLARRKPVG
jgi:hypothetical protein